MSQDVSTYSAAGTTSYTAPSTLLNGMVTATAWGAPGAGGTGGSKGGNGGAVTGTVQIAPGGTLTVNVGDTAGHGIHAGGVVQDASAGNGGGSSGVLSGATVLIEAGGGGGAGGYQPNSGNVGGQGGTGGSTTGGGANGVNVSYGENFGTGGLGGSQGGGGGTGGAFDGNPGSAQSGGTGGQGAAAENASNPGGAGGGGGGGGHVGGGGGGGGGANSAGGGGGGGMSFVDASVLSPSFGDGSATAGSVTVTATVADPPRTPTLNSPAANAYLDADAAGVTFVWTYNPGTDSGSQAAYALRISIDGGGYQYWNATSGALQASEVWNDNGTWDVTVPAGVISDGHTIAWSVATEESHYGLQGPYASDSSFQATVMPTVTVTAPTGSVSSAAPTVQWSETLGSGDAQTGFRVVVYTKSVTTQTGFAPGSTTPTVDSGSVVGAGLSWTLSAPISQGDWVAYVQVTETGGVASQWASSGFTVAFDPPAAPTVSGAAGTDGNGVPNVTVTVTTHDNLVSYDDSTFENGPGTWTPGANATLAVSSSAAEDGSESLAVTASGAGVVAPSTSGRYAVTGGVTYTGMASLKAASTSRGWTLGIQWKDSTGAVVSTTTGAAVTDDTTAWTQATVTGMAPAGTVAADLIVTSATAVAASEVHYVDEVALYSAAIPPAWSRGGLIGSQLVTVERSTDGGTTWVPVRDGVLVSVPSNTEQVAVTDYEAPFDTLCQYQATVSANVATPVPGTVTSAAATAVVTTPAAKWVLSDPLNPANAIILSRVRVMSTDADTVMSVPTSVEFGATAQMAVFYGWGSTYPIVQRGVVQAPTFTIAAYLQGKAVYDMWLTLTGRKDPANPVAATLLLRSDMGDAWYVAVGPVFADQLLRAPDRVTNPQYVVTIPCTVTSAP